ncbi:MAG TPA: FAD-binding dehydrogenase [Candidatus Limnocylindria bacterium]|nr:FAD-binding dehydrogenase [Candidatus Limnocylindria bacterium]
MPIEADVAIVGAGLAGLVAACEAADGGRSVVVLEQEPEASLGGQAFWSLGGLFMVDTPEQRRLRIRDSHDLALADWMRAAAFDRAEDDMPRLWAEAYVAFASGEMRPWLRDRGLRWFPVVGWAERRWNSVPRFHLTWGTGPGVLEPFVRGARERGVRVLHRHRVGEITTSGGRVDGVRGEVLEACIVERGRASPRTAVGEFAVRAGAVIVTSGGIGADHDLVRAHWPTRLGPAPAALLSGVPEHVDGRGIKVAERAGAHVIGRDRMWHYVEGVASVTPIWRAHGIRILPGPSSLWVDATGRRLPAALYPGADTLGTLAHLGSLGYDHSWFVLTYPIVRREFALSGSEQNPDLTGRSWRLVLARLRGAPAPVRALMEKGVDFIVEPDLPALLRRMRDLSGGFLEADRVARAIAERDAAVKDASDEQGAAIRRARELVGERIVRVARPHALTDPKAGPLIAVRLRVLTRKTLGGIRTDLSARVLREDGGAVPGLYAAGEAAGFGGGGMHGYRALEGTFLGGCIFSGRAAGRAAGTG